MEYMTEMDQVLEKKPRKRTRLRDLWYGLARNKGGTLGLMLVIFFSLVAILAPWVAPFSQFDTNAGPVLHSPLYPNIFGTDDLGRDILSGVIWGARPSLLVGIVSAGIAVVLGAVIGIAAGYYGGLVDDVLMRFTEMIMMIPIFILAVVVAAFFGPSLPFIVMVISLLIWPGTAKVARSETMRIKQMEFVQIAKSFGASGGRILIGEILPNIVGPIVVTWTLGVGFSILMAAGLSFVGLGDINYPDWGYMLQRSMIFINRAWWMSVFPGLAIFIVVFAFNLIGDAISDAFNPKAIAVE